MMYGFETWALTHLVAMEMRMLRWMSGVKNLKRGRIRNKRIRRTTKAGEISKKVQESDLIFVNTYNVLDSNHR